MFLFYSFTWTDLRQTKWRSWCQWRWYWGCFFWGRHGWGIFWHRDSRRRRGNKNGEWDP